MISKECGSFEILIVENTHVSPSGIPGVSGKIQGSTSVVYPGLTAPNLAA